MGVSRSEGWEMMLRVRFRGDETGSGVEAENFGLCFGGIRLAWCSGWLMVGCRCWCCIFHDIHSSP